MVVRTVPEGVTDGVMERLATIDVGTNTALLLITGSENGRLRVWHDETQFVRLGRGVDARGFIEAASIGRLCDTLLYYKIVAESWGAGIFVLAGTSASRDARNKAELVEIVRRTTDLTYEIISGEKEALWSFQGAVSGIRQAADFCLVLDIGGGSTELSLGAVNPDSGNPKLVDSVSFDIGSVRVTERFFGAWPPAAEAIEEAAGWISHVLHGIPFEIPRRVDLIGASGTTTALAMLDLQRNVVDPLLPVLDPPLSREFVHAWRKKVMSLDRDTLLALNPVAMRGREDVFPAGVLILELVMEALGVAEVAVSTRGLRHGLALKYWTSQAQNLEEHKE